MIILIIPNVIVNTGLVDNAEGRLSMTKKSFVFICFALVYFIFTFVAGARYYVGTDYLTYTVHQIPDELSGSMVAETNGYLVEPLYRLVIHLGDNLGSYQWIFVLTHVIFMFFVISYLRDRSSNYILSIYIFVAATFYNFSLNGMRQAIATAIFLYATKYISNQKIWHYYLFIIIAIMFHKSAIAYIPFYIFSRINVFKNRQLLKWIVISIPILFVFKQKLYDLLYFISFRFNFYTKFFGSKFDVGQYGAINIFLLLLNFTILVCIYLFMDDDRQEYLYDHESLSKAINIDLWIQILATLFSAISFLVPASSRVFQLFMPIQIAPILVFGT